MFLKPIHFALGSQLPYKLKGFIDGHNKQMCRWQSATYNSYLKPFQISIQFGLLIQLTNDSFCLDSIWIGSSIIHLAHVYAMNLSRNQDQLDQQTSILQHGIRGMVWEQLYPKIQFLFINNEPTSIDYSLLDNNRGQYFAKLAKVF